MIINEIKYPESLTPLPLCPPPQCYAPTWSEATTEEVCYPHHPTSRPDSLSYDLIRLGGRLAKESLGGGSGGRM